MANTVLIQTVEDGARNVKLHVVMQGDGSGEESKLKIAEVLALNPVCDRLRLVTIEGRFEGFKGTLYWGSTSGSEQLLMELPDDDWFKFRPDVPDPRSADYSGDIVLDTDGLGAGDEGHFDMHMIKKGRHL